MSEVAEKIRQICTRLLDEPQDSARWERYRFELKALVRDLAAEQKAWNKPSETDTPQDEARQSYRSREEDSADGFAEGMKLFKPTKRDSEKKKD
jgi:hypothetical protein